MKYVLTMNDKCEDCGLCTRNKYIQDNFGDKPNIYIGIISEDEKDTVQNIIDVCPVGALSLSEAETISIEVCSREIDELLNSLTLDIPCEDEFSYDSKYNLYSLSRSAEDEWKHIYNSKEEAKNAGCKSVERNILCNRANCVRQILNNYSIDKLAPYLDYEDCEGNFYFDSIKKAESILRNAYDLILQATDGYPIMKEYITMDPSIVNCKEMYWKKHEINELSGKVLEIVREIRRNTGDRFRAYIETDCSYESKETLWGYKEKEKYAFYGLHQVAEEVMKDITVAVERNFQSKVQNPVYRDVKALINCFQTVLINKMRNQLKELLEDVQYYLTVGESPLSDSYFIHNTETKIEDYSGRFGNTVKDFWETYSLQFGKKVSVINNNTKKEEVVIIDSSKKDNSVSFSGESYFDKYVIFVKDYGTHFVDILRLNYLSGRVDVMLKGELQMDSISIGYNDELHAWWHQNDRLYLWDAKKGQVKNVSTNGVYQLCHGNCIGSDREFAYINDDGCYKYSYQTGECKKIQTSNWQYNFRFRNNELYYVTYAEPRKLCNEKEGEICKPIFPGPNNLTANDDYIVWYQRGEGYYDRDVYVFNRKTKECKKILSFTEKTCYQSEIYFWIREKNVEVVWMYPIPGHIFDKEVNKWIVSLNGGLSCQKKERITEKQRRMVHIFYKQSCLENTLPDIFFE